MFCMFNYYIYLHVLCNNMPVKTTIIWFEKYFNCREDVLNTLVV